ncbi:uncharacterized protein A4U43_C06F11680 [Asparagus officinalis]|uniref:Uncharacterized protein n=1 Tax=Asparagus officinalis TaxID=4686 RepID=A0A5P1EL89_ASPOF|nr:uncharacterized protein A4U43_C06F11680 [Asparagus officinalis]
MICTVKQLRQNVSEEVERALAKLGPARLGGRCGILTLAAGYVSSKANTRSRRKKLAVAFQAKVVLAPVYGRGIKTEEQVQKRLRNMKAELEQGRAPSLFDHVLVNDDLETCYQNMKK